MGFVKASKSGGMKQWGYVGRYDNYLRGELEKQKAEGVIKTNQDLYDSFHCQRDNFTKSAMSYMRFHHPDNDFKVKAYQYTFSYHPNDRIENNLTPELAHKISMELSEKYFKDYPTLIVTHIDKGHLHTQVIVANCRASDGKSLQITPKKLNQMKKDLGKKCKENNLSYSINRSDKENFKPKPQKDIGEIKVKERVGYTNKEIVGQALRENVRNSTSIQELKDRLLKAQITLKESGKKYYTVSHPEFGKDKKGENRKYRTTNLGKEYSMEREEIEKQIAENAERAVKEFSAKSELEKQEEIEKRMYLDRRNMEIRNRESIEKQYEEIKDNAYKNANEIKENESKIQTAKDENTRTSLYEERERLFEMQKDLQEEMRRLSEKYNEISMKIAEINQEISQRYTNKDKRIITDMEHMNNLPLDSDIGKLNQKVAIGQYTYDREREEEKNILSENDLNNAEYINKGLKERREYENGTETERYSTDNEQYAKARTGATGTSDKAIRDNRGVEESVSGSKEKNENAAKRKHEFENGTGKTESTEKSRQSRGLHM